MLSQSDRKRHLHARRSVDAAIARQLLPMEWRTPWWAWQLVSWGVATFLAPTVWVTALLLLIDPRSDHPFFWASLIVMVGLGNAVAILRVNQLHHRSPFVDRRRLCFCYVATAVKVGIMMFLISAWLSGFTADMTGLPHRSQHPVLLVFQEGLWSAGLAVVLCLLSFSHSGLVHSRLVFSGPGWKRIS